MRGRLYKKGIIAKSSTLDDAIATLESQALFDGAERTVHVRTAQADGKLYIDLCNKAWEVVEVSEDGWRVTSQCPVNFVRKEGMAPLPTPIKGGEIKQLRPFLNVTDTDWLVVVAWLMAAIRATGPYPILVVNGEHGCCKSTICKRLRSLVDPNTAPIRKPPKDDHTLMIWANNSHVIAMDNLSSMPTWLSDGMCRLATGGGHSERALYSDDSEKLFFAVRPQMVNGIEDVAIRSDFLDRALTIHAPVLPKPSRKEEEELDQAFEEVYPGIFGAMLTAACQGLKRLPEVRRMKQPLPRLADFARWIMAVETALGWESGTFMGIMARNEDDSNENVVAASVVGETIRMFVTTKRSWEGTWSDLLADLNDYADDRVKRSDGWPHDSRTLSNKVRLLVPNFRGVGIDVQFHDNDRPKRVTLTSMAARPQPASYEATRAGDDAPSEAKTTTGMDRRYRSAPHMACYEGGWVEPAQASVLYEKLRRFWTVPPLSVAPVAAPTQFPRFCDGAEVPSA